MSKLKQSFLTIAIGLALAAGISYAWNPPTAVPPNNNAPAPINVSGNTQNFVDTKILKVKEGFGALNLRGALRVDGVFQLVDETQGAGKVLTSDAEGKASWKEFAGGGDGVNGNGTKNYISKWIENTKIGNSQIYDNGTNVGIGTNNPQEKLHINGKIKITDGTQGTGKFLTSDATGKASWAYSTLSGYEIKTATKMAAGPVIAYCSVSKKIIGGGCSYNLGIEEYSLNAFHASHPVTGGTNGWRCYRSDGVSNTDTTITVYAICAN